MLLKVLRRLGSLRLSVTPYFSCIISRPVSRLLGVDSWVLSPLDKTLTNSVKSFSSCSFCSLIVSSVLFSCASLFSVTRIGYCFDARSNVLSSNIRLKGIGSSPFKMAEELLVGLFLFISFKVLS